jgi:hypothetical protein
VDNVVDGFDVHDLHSGAFIRTLRTGKASWTLPKQVAFAEESRLVVAGSDNGAAYIFDSKSGQQLQVLRHNEDGLVQTVTVGGF